VRILRYSSLAAAGALFLAPWLQAQAPHATIVKGAVNIRRGDTALATPLDTATALQEGDCLASEAKSFAVVLLDGVNSFQLSANSEVRMAQLDAAHFHITIVSGALIYHVDGPGPATAEVHTPSVTVLPSQAGVYSVAIKPGGESEIIPREGSVQVTAPGGSQWVHPGEKMIARGDPANPEFRITPAVSRLARAMIVLANVIQVIDVVGSFGGGGGGRGAALHQRAANSPRPVTPTPAPHGPPPPARGR